MNKSSPPLALACADGTHFDKITVELCRAGNISQGDTLGGILNAKRGVPGAQMHSWLKRLRALNPHISNLNRIYPGERILIPQNLSEPVSDDAVWSNAFSRIPKALEFPHA
ncbi:MAG: LysM peptidoglycan-binding domain-containing protein, partial [Desulfatitalea sp.]|nr:LysM peptidoglycan-binding domain-containing protein [Desulfatitalea sp.]